MARPENRREVRDVRMLSALAHPVRTALLSHLMAVGPRTASECAEAVGASPSNCSWHLRQLEKFGFVERAEDAADGRERPWRAAATGFDFSQIAAEPAARGALQTFAAIRLDEENRLARAYLRGEDDLPEEWRRSADLSTYGLLLTPAELLELSARLDAAIRPYLAATRDDAPAGARPVHLFLSAFLRPDAS
ncbi:MAG TPA: winged helix-turn-helix domain-containing protein [Mycobacteriales bacterium]|jgi:DNA-binding MarR family transcriptional regulator|nr:winged helix-turn-helix domain-containing protein [Mycobacteriales bacterium]